MVIVAAGGQYWAAMEDVMSMSKKDFIALADEIMEHNRVALNRHDMSGFTSDQIQSLADFCQSQNSNFMRDRWLGYISGECGSNGGTIRKPAA